jgi:FtsP/CotA-like multicopper oxidase with cupredoxin domain
VYRYRLLNGSNARFYHLQLKGQGQGASMYQIGSDGGLLNAPVPITQLTIAPGERADLLIDFRAAASGQKITLTNDAPTPFPNGPRAARRGGMDIPEIMQFQVGSGPAVGGGVPARLRGGPGQNPAIPTADQYAAKVKDTGGQNRRVFLNELLDAASGEPVKGMLDNLPFHAPADRLEAPRDNTVETWTFINTTGDTHPIHMHLSQLRVLTRQKINGAKYLAAVNTALAPQLPAGCPGLPDPCAAERGPSRDAVPDAAPFTIGGPSPIPATEQGWKDTVQVNPGEAVTVVAAFGGTPLAQKIGLPLPYTASYSGQYVLHCHILEHEDNDMMLPYTVTPAV